MATRSLRDVIIMSQIEIYSEFNVGDLTITFLRDSETNRVALQMVPCSMKNQRVTRRRILSGSEIDTLPDSWKPLYAWNVESLVQVQICGEDSAGGFSQGRTMRNGRSTESLSLVSQSVSDSSITTFLSSPFGYDCEHILSWGSDPTCLSVEVVFINRSERVLTLEMLASFSLSGLSPFHTEDASLEMMYHRFRSAWSGEGRLESGLVEDIQLERSWSGHGVSSERFGQIGSMPCRGFFPFVAVEDTKNNVTWGGQVAHPASWQMEIYRRDDCISISGGISDREFGHWTKDVPPSGTFRSPPAIITVAIGGLEDVCNRLRNAQTDKVRGVELDCPIIFNEWCTTWGEPTEQTISDIVEKLQGTKTRYFVIDAGWYGPPGGQWGNGHGEWIPNQERFPNGLKAVADIIKNHGLIPGLWFEFETISGPKHPVLDEHVLTRDGFPVTSARRFLDFRDEWVVEFLSKRVIRLLKECDFGYLKIDYNETIGLGCDGAESLGEGLRQQMAGVVRFIELIKKELPDLVIESCSSGGNRLEPSMIGLTDLSSFSDAHETVEIPVIAANLQRLVPPAKLIVWAVLRAGDSNDRLVYSLAATFIGRMCFSGDITLLIETQWEILKRAQDLFTKTSPILKHCVSFRYGITQRSLRKPEGWQAVVHYSGDRSCCLVIVHTFSGLFPSALEIPLLGRSWRISDSLKTDSTSAVIGGLGVRVLAEKSFCGMVLHLMREGSINI